jgi:integrase
MRIDPYKHKERYLKWKDSLDGGIRGISKKNSYLILNYLLDMEHGLNVASGSRKGSRSYVRLNNLKQRMVFLIKLFEEKLKLTDITKVEERQLHEFFSKIRNGEIKRLDGKVYKSPGDYVKIFKAFWHWWQKLNRKKGTKIEDVTVDLDIHNKKPEWVYLDEGQIKKMCDNALYDYKVLIMFLFDTGIRAPTELMNIRVSDFYNEFKELNIREEVSKTFGRRIKLMLCSDLIREYISDKKLVEDDFLFTKQPYSMNKYLHKLAKKLFGDAKSPAGQRYNELTLYDFRHCSCCYWLPRYKSESALKFRFGWKKSDKIHYYSEMLGMRDTISEEDMLVDVTKTEIEQRLIKAEQDKSILNERMKVLEKQMVEILGLVKQGAVVSHQNWYSY